MLPKNIDKLLIAGRCMSSEQIAYESWLTMAYIFAIGEFAGTAGVLAVKSGVNVRQIDVKRLQNMLMEQGAEIGQGRNKYKLLRTKKILIQIVDFCVSL